MVELGKGAGDALEVQIVGKPGTIKVPFMADLPMRWILAFRKAGNDPDEHFNLVYELFCDYLGEDVVGSLTLSDFEILAEAWRSASGDDGASMGESSASPES